jgi:hypothetical protein
MLTSFRMRRGSWMRNSIRPVDGARSAEGRGRQVLVFLWSVAVAAFILPCLTGCSGNRIIAEGYRVVNQYAAIELAVGVSEHILSCDNDGVLLGAGYDIDPAEVDLGDAVAVIASHPREDNSWFFSAKRETEGTATVSTHLHCLYGPDEGPEINSSVVASNEVTLSFSPRGIGRGTASVFCPPGSTLTAGGFSLRIPGQESYANAESYNGWIWSSWPDDNRSGWTATASFIARDELVPRIRSHALCISRAEQVLRSLAMEEATAVAEDDVNFGRYRASANCGPDGFPTAGGFRLQGDELVPRSISRNQVVGDFQGWSLLGVFGFQVGDSAALELRLLCFESLPVETMKRPDLTPSIESSPLNVAGCQDAEVCFSFRVTNVGEIEVPASQALYRGADGTSMAVEVQALAVGESTILSIGVPSPCLNDCGATVTVDSSELIRESNENNNTDSWSEVG